MKRIKKHESSVVFTGEYDERMIARYDNRGEPYREGISVELEDGSDFISVFLEDREARELRDLLIKIYPLPTRISRCL